MTSIPRNSQHEPLEALEALPYIGLNSTVSDQSTSNDLTEIFEKAINHLKEQHDQAQEQEEIYLKNLSNPLNEFALSLYHEAKARNFYYIQMYNFCVEKGLQNFEDLQKITVKTKLPEFKETDIVTQILAHQKLFKECQAYAAGNDLLNLEARARSLYHRQMFYALSIEYDKLNFRKLDKQEALAEIIRQVQDELNNLTSEPPESFLKERIRILEEKKDNTLNPQLFALKFELHKILYEKARDESHGFCSFQTVSPAATAAAPAEKPVNS